MKLFLKSQSGSTSLLFLVAAVGLVGFLLLSSSLEFKDRLFAALYPKQASFAAGETVENEILVKFNKDVSLNKEDLRAKFGISFVGMIKDIDVERWQVDLGKREEILESLKGSPDILFAEPNYVLRFNSNCAAGPGNILGETCSGTALDAAGAIIDAADKEISTISINFTSEYSHTIQAALNFVSNKGVRIEK